MRVALLWVAMLASACLFETEHGKGGGTTCAFAGKTFHTGDTFPAGDGCNSCSCTATGVVCTERACPVFDAGVGVDANQTSCAASGGCPSGPVCGTLCCGAGERCDNGTCTCGGNPACTGGNTCEAAGPSGGNACGSICCGVSGPCPV